MQYIVGIVEIFGAHEAETAIDSITARDITTVGEAMGFRCAKDRAGATC